MKSITIENIDPVLARRIQLKAKEMGTSISGAIQMLLKESLKPGNSRRKKEDEYRDLCGVWTAADAAEFKKNIADCEEINASEWQ